jgi:hypothetical protein
MPLHSPENNIIIESPPQKPYLVSFPGSRAPAQEGLPSFFMAAYTAKNEYEVVRLHYF